MKRGGPRNGEELHEITSFARGTARSEFEQAGLMELGPQPHVVLSGEVSMAVAEWVRGWNHAALLQANGCPPPGGLLLYGPTGSGKTTTGGALAKQFHRPPRLAALMESHQMMDKYLGESARRIAAAFAVCARHGALLIMEEIDGMVETRRDGDSSAGQERNSVVVALMRLIESATFPIVATTNRKDSLDPALLRRFEFKVEVREPDEDARRVILEGILGSEPDDQLVAMPMAASVPWARRLKRERILDEAELAEGAP